jgi:hypothetical protein
MKAMQMRMWRHMQYEEPQGFIGFQVQEGSVANNDLSAKDKA